MFTLFAQIPDAPFFGASVLQTSRLIPERFYFATICALFTYMQVVVDSITLRKPNKILCTTHSVYELHPKTITLSKPEVSMASDTLKHLTSEDLDIS